MGCKIQFSYFLIVAAYFLQMLLLFFALRFYYRFYIFPDNLHFHPDILERPVISISGSTGNFVHYFITTLQFTKHSIVHVKKGSSSNSPVNSPVIFRDLYPFLDFDGVHFWVRKYFSLYNVEFAATA